MHEPYPEWGGVGGPVVVVPINASTEKVWWGSDNACYYIRYTKEYAAANFEKFEYRYIDLGKPFDHAELDEVLGLSKRN